MTPVRLEKTLSRHAKHGHNQHMLIYYWVQDTSEDSGSRGGIGGPKTCLENPSFDRFLLKLAFGPPPPLEKV